MQSSNKHVENEEKEITHMPPKNRQSLKKLHIPEACCKKRDKNKRVGVRGKKMKDQDIAAGKLLPCMKSQLSIQNFISECNTNKKENPKGHAAWILVAEFMPEKMGHAVLNNME